MTGVRAMMALTQESSAVETKAAFLTSTRVYMMVEYCSTQHWYVCTSRLAFTGDISVHSWSKMFVSCKFAVSLPNVKSIYKK